MCLVCMEHNLIHLTDINLIGYIICQELSNSRLLAKSLKSASLETQDLPAGYRPVRIKWKDLDKCNVCHMDEVRNCDTSYVLSSFS